MAVKSFNNIKPADTDTLTPSKPKGLRRFPSNDSLATAALLREAAKDDGSSGYQSDPNDMEYDDDKQKDGEEEEEGKEEDDNADEVSFIIIIYHCFSHCLLTFPFRHRDNHSSRYHLTSREGDESSPC